MLHKDAKIIDFINSYRTEIQTPNELFRSISKIGFSSEQYSERGDTVTRQIILRKRGLLHLLIRYSYRDGKIIRKYYDLEINNPIKASFTQPFTYHKMIFRQLKFCLGIRFSCYHFEDEF